MSQEPSLACWWTSMLLIICVYLSAIWTITEIKQFVSILNFNHDFFKCRQPILNTTYIISFLFVLYILNPITLFLSNVLVTHSTVSLFVNDIADILIFLVFFPRAWILWFDRAFVDNIKNWVWRREINPKDTNGLIRHRKHLHSPHLLVYTVYLLFIAPIFTVLLILPYYNIIPLYCHIMRIMLLLVLVTSTGVIVYNISVVTDEWNVRSELLSSVKSTGIAYTLSHIFYVAIKEIWGEQHWALLIELLFVCIADLFVVYYACRWTRKKHLFLQKVRLMEHLKTYNGCRFSFNSFLQTPIQFHDIMDYKDGVQAFCNHLVNEYGLESMLFLLEVTQFKAIIRKMSNNTLEDNVPDLCSRHEHASEHVKRVFSAVSILNVSWLPINPKMFSLTPYEIAVHLYDKYIEESADLCINISFEIRKEIYRYFQQLSQEEDNISMHDLNVDINMYTIYDSAFTEIWRLIQTDSFHRFRATPEFQRLISVLMPEEADKANKEIIEIVDAELSKERNKTKSLKKQQKNIQKKLYRKKHSNKKIVSAPIIIDILENNYPDVLTLKSDAKDAVMSASLSTIGMIPNANPYASNSSMQYESMVTINSMVNSEESTRGQSANTTNDSTSLDLPKLHFQQHSLPCFKIDSGHSNSLPQLKFSHSL